MSENLNELNRLLSQVLESKELNNLNVLISNNEDSLYDGDSTPNSSDTERNDQDTELHLDVNKYINKENDKIIHETYQSFNKINNLQQNTDVFEKDDIDQNETDENSETDETDERLEMNVNNRFVYNFTNNLLVGLMMIEFYNILFDFNKESIYIFIVNLFMFLFYNSSSDVFVETQIDIYNNFSKYLNSFFNLLKRKCNQLITNFMDYFFSKHTQFLFNFALNIVKKQIKNKYMYYKNKLLNPPLLTQTINEDVYYLSFYLNGERYKIPIVVNKSGLDKNEPPLMVIDHNEQDITQKILEFMGPNYDFYGMFLKPKHLNQKNLNFMLNDGSEMNILNNDLIAL